MDFADEVLLGHTLTDTTNSEANVFVVCGLGLGDGLLPGLLANCTGSESASKACPASLGRRLFTSGSASLGLCAFSLTRRQLIGLDDFTILVFNDNLKSVSRVRHS